jgi:hypothetical protein
VERIPMPSGEARRFRAQLARSGDELAFSYDDEASGKTVLRRVALDSPAMTPTTIVDDGAEWVLANDSAAVYFLRGVDETTALGELAWAEFPSGDNVQAIAPDVAHIDPAGAFDDIPSDVDRGIGYDRWTADGPSFEFLSDRNEPSELVTVGVNVEAPRVSPNGAYSLFYRHTGGVWPTATVRLVGCTVTDGG